MIIVRAPVRVSFGGGGTDMEAYYSRYGGAVLSTAINKFFYSIYQPRTDNKIQIISSDFQIIQSVEDYYHLKFGEGLDIPNAVIKYFKVNWGFDLFTASEIPPGSGLGGSGAVTVNLVKLFSMLNGKKESNHHIAEISYKIQRENLNLYIGKQDEYASAVGGLNLIEFSNNSVKVIPLRMEKEVFNQLQNNLLLFYSGQTRKASTILDEQDRSIRKKEKAVLEAMHNIKQNAYRMKESLESGNLDDFGRLLNQAWIEKKKMNPGISNSRIESMYKTAISSGALGAKISGAGGGGFFIVYCPRSCHEKIIANMAKLNFQTLDFQLVSRGVEVIVNGK